MAALNFQEMEAKVKKFVDDRSWSKYHRPKDIAIALSIEASELLEIFQWSGNNERLDKETIDRIRFETADTAIYALSMANACGFDLGEAIEEKMALNERKYPIDKSKDMFG
jgi:NTP pyrophosphatase (non-canonical NTP hydrolase)